MCYLIGASEGLIKKCPAREAVYLYEKTSVETLEFVDDSFMHAFGCTGHAPGVVINGAVLGLIHTLTFLDCRPKRRLGPIMNFHFTKVTVQAVQWQYYY